MKNDIDFMFKCYPTLREPIKEVYEVNDEFRALCEDLHAIALTIERNGDKVNRDFHADLEYYKLRAELESEFLNFLDAGYRSKAPHENKGTR